MINSNMTFFAVLFSDSAVLHVCPTLCILVRRLVRRRGTLLHCSVVCVSRYRGCALILRRIWSGLGVRPLHRAVVGGRSCGSIRDRRHNYRRIGGIVLSGRRGFRDVSSRRAADQARKSDTNTDSHCVI